jgi:hypothetical protein
MTGAYGDRKRACADGIFVTYGVFNQTDTEREGNEQFSDENDIKGESEGGGTARMFGRWDSSAAYRDEAGSTSQKASTRSVGTRPAFFRSFWMRFVSSRARP